MWLIALASSFLVDWDPRNKFQLAKAVRVGMHEITHALGMHAINSYLNLGFSSFHYSHYVDANGKPHEEPVKSLTIRGGHVHMVRNLPLQLNNVDYNPHYCTNGSRALWMRHHSRIRTREQWSWTTWSWKPLGNEVSSDDFMFIEIRLTGTEYMSPTVDEQIPISALSLALLKGLYNPPVPDWFRQIPVGMNQTSAS